MKDFDLIIVGGGAAGFFTAINAAENNPKLKIAILEKGKSVLSKVKISGGGRCNLCHACFDPKDLSTYYPRGSKALLGPFHHFCSGDTIAWFEDRGIKTKIEEDGRMFPISNDSQTIIDCFWKLAKKKKIQVITQCRLDHISPPKSNAQSWKLKTSQGDFNCEKLMLGTGSNPRVWSMLKQLGHTIIDPVPSLFTFNIKDPRIKDLLGISVPNAQLEIPDAKLSTEGPLLITHWGLSGPAILKMSSWGARSLHGLNYKFNLKVNWLYPNQGHEIINQLKEFRTSLAKKQIRTYPQFGLANRLWKQLMDSIPEVSTKRWLELSNKHLELIAQVLCESVFQVNGKSTFKEEFVTAGGVELDEINFKTFESKVHKNLFMAGEVLNIDALTGGFNFQAAWTGSWIAAQAISK